MTSDEATGAVIDALRVAGVPLMLVGSLSSNAYGVARSTQDADIVIRPTATPIAAIVRTLGPAFVLDPQMSFETVTTTHRYIIRVPEIEFTIELFLLSDDPHDQERFARRRPTISMGRSVDLPTAEDVIVTKLRWSVSGARKKDVEDVRNVLAVQGDRLDWDYIHRWCDAHGTRALLDGIRQSIPAR